jgi:hypothetical protein
VRTSGGKNPNDLCYHPPPLCICRPSILPDCRIIVLYHLFSFQSFQILVVTRESSIELSSLLHVLLLWLDCRLTPFSNLPLSDFKSIMNLCRLILF